MNELKQENNTIGSNLIDQILRLEGDIESKNKEIARNQNEILLLRRELENYVQIIRGVSKLLSGATSDLKNELCQHLGRMEGLVIEKNMLECSNDVWSNRSLTFQVELLKAKDKIKEVEAVLEGETRKVAQLEAELRAIKTGNGYLR